MATTSNFGWTTPDDTDLVKDGAAAIRTLGSAIDTSLVDLKGGTTGQVLSKTSNTDMDFTWVAQDDTDAIQSSIIAAKGDLIVGTANDTAGILSVGTDGYTLVADSSTATGLAYAAPAASGGWTQLATGTLSGAETTISSISGAYRNLQIVVRNVLGASASALRIRFNGDSGTNYFSVGTTSTGNAFTYDESNGLFAAQTHTSGNSLIVANIPDYANTATPKLYDSLGITQNTGTPNYNIFLIRGAWNDTSAINSVTFRYGSGNIASGTYFIYGVK